MHFFFKHYAAHKIYEQHGEDAMNRGTTSPWFSGSKDSNFKIFKRDKQQRQNNFFNKNLHSFVYGGNK